MKVTRLTPPPPPQVEFQLTVSAEELAVIKLAVGRIECLQDAGSLADRIYNAIPGNTGYYSNAGTLRFTDVDLNRVTRIISEAN